MVAAGIVVILAGVILLLAGKGQSVQNKSFADAQSVTGTVTDKRKRKLKNGTACELTVAYTVSGAEYSKVVGVSLSGYNEISEGDGFELKYRPDKPQKAISPDALNPKKARSVLVFGAGLTGAGLVLLHVGVLIVR